MRKYVYFVWLISLSGIFVSCGAGESGKAHKIILKNTSSVELRDKAISIKREDLPGIDGKLFPLITNQAGDTIPSQVDDLNGDNEWDQLFFVTNLSPNEQAALALTWIDSQVKFEKRSHIRFGVRNTLDSRVKPATIDTFYANQLPGVIGYQRYQTDGPTWENDKVGFRLYLDGRNSVDVFGKKVSYMTPDDVGINAEGVTENNYNQMHEWGRDILAVGNSVGIGGVSLLINDTLARLGVTEQDSLNNVDTTIFRILSNGPVRANMRFVYKNWKPLDRNYFVEETTSIWPGMYAYNNSVRFNNLTGDETLVVGLVNSNTDQKLTEISINDKWVVLLTHDKQAIDKEWWLGMALILPKEHYLGYMEAPKTGSLSTTYLGKLKVENNKPVNYFAVASWELSDKGFRDPVYFKEYVTNLVNQLSAEVTVKVE